MKKIIAMWLVLCCVSMTHASMDTKRYLNGMKTVDQGEGWQKVRFEDKALLKMPKAKGSKPVTLPAGFDELYIVEGSKGIKNSPLPRIIKDDLLNDLQAIPTHQRRQTKDGSFASIPESDVFLVHAGMAKAIANGDVSAYEEFAEYGDPILIDNLDGRDDEFTQPLSAVPGLSDPLAKAQSRGGCWGWKNRSKSFSGNLSDILNETLFDDAKISGKFDVRFYTTGNNQPRVKGTINYAIKKWLCIPYKVRFRNVHAEGVISADDASLKVVAEIKKNQLIAKKWQLKNIRLGRSLFFIGPVPVYVGANLPIDAGFDVNVKATGEVGIETHGQGAYEFDLVCNFKRCDGSTSNTFAFHQGIGAEVVAGVDVNLNVIPYLEASVEGFLYDPWVLSARIGVRPEVDGWVWGYWGNACGDANDDGINETVSAAVLDISARLKLIGSYRLFGPSKSFLNSKLFDWHLGFTDFFPGGSSALEPILKGPEFTGQDIITPYQAKMRPCIPFKDKVNYEVVWDDGQTQEFSASPSTHQQIPHTWVTPGVYTVSLTAIKDEKNRHFDSTTEREITVYESDVQNLAPYARPEHSRCPVFEAGNTSCYGVSKINDLRTTDHNGAVNIAPANTVSLTWSTAVKSNNVAILWEAGSQPKNYYIEAYDEAMDEWYVIKHILGNKPAFQIHHFDEVITKALRIRVSRGHIFDPKIAKLIEFYVYGEFETTNIAPQATASSFRPFLDMWTLYHPRFANDGNADTAPDPNIMWSSMPIHQPNHIWYRLDWIEPMEMSQIDLISADGYANRDYKVQYLSGGNWVNLAVVNNNTSSMRSHTFNTISTKAIRIVFDHGHLHANGINSANLSEVEVY